MFRKEDMLRLEVQETEGAAWIECDNFARLAPGDRARAFTQSGELSWECIVEQPAALVAAGGLAHLDPRKSGPWRAEFGALLHDDHAGFAFTVSPPAFAEDVARALNEQALHNGQDFRAKLAGCEP